LEAVGIEVAKGVFFPALRTNQGHHEAQEKHGRGKQHSKDQTDNA
jgi:hypothetical protein